MVLHLNRHGHPSREDATLDHVRMNEVMTRIAFGGRRRGVYARGDLPLLRCVRAIRPGAS